MVKQYTLLLSTSEYECFFNINEVEQNHSLGKNIFHSIITREEGTALIEKFPHTMIASDLSLAGHSGNHKRWDEYKFDISDTQKAYLLLLLTKELPKSDG